MPVEYMTCGHVSAKTDAFAFAILLVEMIIGVSPQAARDVQASSASFASKLVSHPTAKLLDWPTSTLKRLACAVQGCGDAYVQSRTSIADVMEALEELRLEAAAVSCRAD